MSRESYNRAFRSGDNYNFDEEERQMMRGQGLRNAARRFARLGGVQTNELGSIIGGQWNRKGIGLSNG